MTVRTDTCTGYGDEPHAFTTVNGMTYCQVCLVEPGRTAGVEREDWYLAPDSAPNDWYPMEHHDPGECDVCDHNRKRLEMAANGDADPGPYPGQRR